MQFSRALYELMIGIKRPYSTRHHQSATTDKHTVIHWQEVHQLNSSFVIKREFAQTQVAHSLSSTSFK